MTPAKSSFVRRLLAWFAPRDLRDAFLDDLDEAFANEAEARGPGRARLWYARQALGGAPILLRMRARRLGPPGNDPRSHTLTMDAITRDLQYALRVLRRSPGFTLAAVFTLALGIGANTAIFTVAWQAILKPLPYPQGDRLVNVWETFLPQESPNPVMPGNFHDWLREAHSFDLLAAYTYFEDGRTLSGVAGADPEQWRIRYVTGDYFRVFGMAPIAGRPLDDADTSSDSRSVVISEFMWRDRFGRDPAIIGRDVRLDDRPHTVVGVMPAAFSVSGGRVDAWAGLSLPPDPRGPRLRAHFLGVVGRLKRGVTVPQAIQDVKAIAARAAQLYPEANGKLSASVESMAGDRAKAVEAGLAILAWAAGAVLLMACVNLASLQLARGVSREHEFGIRAALGAGWGRLVAQLLCESLMLSVAGAAAGLILGSWLLHSIAALAPDAVKDAAGAGIEPVMILYASALALLAGFLSAAAPAWRAARRATRGSGTRLRIETGDRRVTVLRTALVAGQMALAVILLVGATLLVTSLVRVLRVDPGFDSSGVLTFDVSLPDTRYGTYEQRARFFSDVMRELRAVPGVVAACAINQVPFNGPGGMTYVPEGQTKMIGASPRNVTPDCFDILRLRIVAGRGFTEREAERVVIVTGGFARQAWPGEDPVGKRLHVGVPTGPFVEVVGVVNDSRQMTLESRPYPQVYEVTSEASAFPPSRMLLRTTVPPASTFAAVRAAVRRVDSLQPVANLRPLADVVNASVSGRSFDLSLISAFSLVALVLATLGIYGLLAQVVAQRTAEIGIRLALGATAGSAVRLVMRNAWLAVGVGLPIGIAGAAAASRLIGKLVFGVSTTEPAVYAVAAVIVGTAALGAAWLAARRAAGVDPIDTLRR